VAGLAGGCYNPPVVPSALLLPLALSLTAASPRGAVATAHPLASEAGAAVLRRGGNAVDAAVAAAFALSVVQNQNSGIGGGGFAVIWLARERAVRVLDFREVAPAAAARDMFLRQGRPDPALSRDGGLAVAVPGAVRGYAELARRFGTRPLRELVEPAARIAASGWTLGLAEHAAATLRLECLRADPAAAVEFLEPGPGGERVPPEPGSRRTRPDLARTLRLLGRDPDAFYRGPLAARVAAAVRARGGVLVEADLAAYRVRDREPLWGSYRGHRLATVPPPSAGGAVLVGLLQALEAEDPGAGGFRPERFLHAFAEVEKRLFARRAGPFGDPDFAPGAEAAAREMASPEAARALHAGIGERAVPSAEVPVPAAAGETSHLSVVDAEGNAVALTTTVNLLHGSCLVVPGTGILLNDQMDDFDAAPGVPNAFGLQGGTANAVAPGKRPLSSMAPTLVFDPQGRLVLAVGSPGGSTIPSTVAQVIVGLLDWGMPLPVALGTPRIHHQWMPDEILAEPFALDADTARALQARGHRLRLAEGSFGNAQAVQVNPGTGWRIGASEPRREGAPAAP
jgi:gamma-glutamyltranspeptidase/glutathione hydrolase